MTYSEERFGRTAATTTRRLLQGEDWGAILGEIITNVLKEKEVTTMQVTYNGFTGELVKLERKESVMTFSPLECRGATKTTVYDLTLYDSEKQATISFTGVKLEDVKFLGGAVAFGG